MKYQQSIVQNKSLPLGFTITKMNCFNSTPDVTNGMSDAAGLPDNQDSMQGLTFSSAVTVYSSNPVNLSDPQVELGQNNLFGSTPPPPLTDTEFQQFLDAQMAQIDFLMQPAIDDPSLIELFPGFQYQNGYDGTVGPIPDEQYPFLDEPMLDQPGSVEEASNLLDFGPSEPEVPLDPLLFNQQDFVQGTSLPNSFQVDQAPATSLPRNVQGHLHGPITRRPSEVGQSPVAGAQSTVEAPQVPAPKSPVQQGPAKINRRRANMEKMNSSLHYEPLPSIPASWGSAGDDGTPIFKYNAYGELAPRSKFSAAQINEYLYSHPLTTSQTGKLILWVQTAPADSQRRYPSAESDKCRFAACPVLKHSIHKGFYRVAFDEQSGSGNEKVDPYHCAGFVHLWCLERFCDFPSMCKTLNVLPDDRRLPEGKNRMAITRDHIQMLPLVERFVKESTPKGEWDYDETLCCALTATHLSLEPEFRQDVREMRGGNHLGVHRGDLEKYVQGEKNKWSERKAGKRAREEGEGENDPSRPGKRGKKE